MKMSIIIIIIMYAIVVSSLSLHLIIILLSSHTYFYKSLVPIKQIFFMFFNRNWFSHLSSFSSDYVKVVILVFRVLLFSLSVSYQEYKLVLCKLYSMQ